MRALKSVVTCDRSIAFTGLMIAVAALVVSGQPELRFRAAEMAAQESVARRERDYREHERRCRGGQFFKDDPRYTQQVEDCPGEPGTSPPTPRQHP